MSTLHEGSGPARPSGPVRAPQNIAGGLVLVALAALALWLTRDLDQGTLNSMGPAMLPRWLAIIIGGYATPEVRLRDLVILSLSLTPFCMILFGDLLNLPIPVFPQALTGLFPSNWSQKEVLRATAAIMAAAAVIVFLVTRGRRRGPVDVADHSGRI